MKKIILLLSVLFMFSNGYAQVTDDYKNTVKKMLVVSGSEATFKTVVGQMINMYKQNKPEVSAAVWNDLEAEFNKSSMDDLVRLLAPIYQKHLSKDDLVKVIEFYESPAGKRFAEKTPFITQESMAAGQEWGRQLGQKVQESLKAKGL